MHSSRSQVSCCALTLLHQLHMHLTQLQRCLCIDLEGWGILLPAGTLKAPDLLQESLLCTYLEACAPATGGCLDLKPRRVVPTAFPCCLDCIKLPSVVAFDDIARGSEEEVECASEGVQSCCLNMYVIQSTCRQQREGLPTLDENEHNSLNRIIARPLLSLQVCIKHLCEPVAGTSTTSGNVTTASEPSNRNTLEKQ